MEKSKEPEDLGIKIGSPEMAEWKDIIDAQEKAIRNSKINIKVAKIVLELAQEEFETEKATFEGK